MTFTLRLILVVASLFCCLWVLLNIRKSKVRIEDSVFWILFSSFLVLISVFPGLIDCGARLTGIQSSQNFLFLIILFVLIIKLFQMTIRMSQMDSKVQRLVQFIAIENKNQDEK